MQKTFTLKNIILYFTQILAMSILVDTSAAYSMPYIIVFTAGIICMYVNNRNETDSRIEKTHVVLACLFSICLSLMIAFGNYELWLYQTLPQGNWKALKFFYRFLMFVVIGGGSFTAFFNILKMITYKKDFLVLKCQNEEARRRFKNLFTVFVSSFLVVLLIDLTVLFVCRYPGCWNGDTFNQLHQIRDNRFNNHHPYYHTVIISLFYNFGKSLFGSAMAGCASYSVFQIIIFALGIGFAVMTLYEMGFSKRIIAIVLGFYSIIPYYIIFSFSATKDSLFAIFVLIFMVAFLRTATYTGKALTNYIILLLAGIGVCLLRNNGFIAFVVFAALVCILKFKKEKIMTVVIVATVIIAFILRGPVLSVLGVRASDSLAAYAVPGQQMCRVIADGCELSEEEKDMINALISTEDIKAKYDRGFFDPIKNTIKANGKEAYLDEHKSDYLKLYAILGIKYPVSYIKGWIDETKGFWNSGYDNTTQLEDVVCENDMEVSRQILSPGANSLFTDYCYIFGNWPALKIFISIGFAVWIMFIYGYYAIVKKNTDVVLMIALNIFICGTLIIASPIYNEFRYIFSLFAAMPFVTMAVFGKKESENA